MSKSTEAIKHSEIIKACLENIDDQKERNEFLKTVIANNVDGLDWVLSFIADDIKAHPERLISMTAMDIHESIDDMLNGIEIDLNEPLDDNEE